MNNRYLVFGATGFIGGHVARLLKKQNQTLKIFCRTTSNRKYLPHIEPVYGDLTNAASVKSACANIDKIIFSAAYYPLVSYHFDQQLMQAKLELNNFLAALPASSELVYVSSLSTIGRAAANSLADETTPYNPSDYQGAYYKIKYELEQIVLSFAKNHPRKVVIVNPTAILGEVDLKPTTSKIVLDAAKGRMLFSFAGTVNAVDIHNVATGILKALDLGRSGERYILGGENLSIGNLLEKICTIVGKPQPRFKISLKTVRSLANGYEYFHRLLHLKSLPLLPVVGVDLIENSIAISSAKAQKELGYVITPIEPAIERAYHWFKEHGYC